MKTYMTLVGVVAALMLTLLTGSANPLRIATSLNLSPIFRTDEGSRRDEGTPVLRVNVEKNAYPLGFVGGRAKVRFLATGWSHRGAERLKLHSTVTFVLYEKGWAREGIQFRSKAHAIAVAFAPTEVVDTDSGRANMISAVADFKLDNVIPASEYELAAFIDVQGDIVTDEVQVFLMGSSFPGGGPAFLVRPNFTVDENIVPGLSLDVYKVSEMPTLQTTIAPDLTIVVKNGIATISWSGVFPDYSVESQSLGQSTWETVTVPGGKQFSTSKRVEDYLFPSEFVFHHSVVIDPGETGKIFRLKAGGVVTLSQPIGDDGVPVTWRGE